MREDLDLIGRWQREAGEIVLATVTATSRSAPLGPGATVALHPDGRVLGSVSGGCVEAAVVEVAQEVLASHVPQHPTYGVSDDEAQAVGLTCGGTIHIFVRRVARTALDLAGVAERLTDDRPTAVVTIVEPGGTGLTAGAAALVGAGQEAVRLSGDAGLDAAIASLTEEMLARGATGLRHLGPRGERSGDEVALLVQSFAPRPRLLVFGAIDFAAALASVGRFLGYHVTVCDARERFATPLRFPDADEVVVSWPHRYLAETAIAPSTAICILTHDPKFDVPALQVALASPAGYVGAMGSRRTHEDRLRRLREAGVDEAALSRLRSPIGLDLGGRSPQATAIAIAAELVADAHGASGRPLSRTDGPIHRASNEAMLTG